MRLPVSFESEIRIQEAGLSILLHHRRTDLYVVLGKCCFHVHLICVILCPVN